MSLFWIGWLAGMFLGACLGVLLTSLCVMAGRRG
jgi:hypothetical protein